MYKFNCCRISDGNSFDCRKKIAMFVFAYEFCDFLQRERTYVEINYPTSNIDMVCIDFQRYKIYNSYTTFIDRKMRAFSINRMACVPMLKCITNAIRFSNVYIQTRTSEELIILYIGSFSATYTKAKPRKTS